MIRRASAYDSPRRGPAVSTLFGIVDRPSSSIEPGEPERRASVERHPPSIWIAGAAGCLTGVPIIGQTQPVLCEWERDEAIRQRLSYLPAPSTAESDPWQLRIRDSETCRRYEQKSAAWLISGAWPSSLAAAATNRQRCRILHVPTLPAQAVRSPDGRTFIIDRPRWRGAPQARRVLRVTTASGTPGGCGGALISGMIILQRAATSLSQYSTMCS